MSDIEVFPDGDAETNAHAHEARQLIRWCAAHPSTERSAAVLEARLERLATEWRGEGPHCELRGRTYYYTRTRSVLFEARALAGLTPHGDPVVE